MGFLQDAENAVGDVGDYLFKAKKADQTPLNDAGARARDATDQLGYQRDSYIRTPAPMVQGVSIEPTAAAAPGAPPAASPTGLVPPPTGMAQGFGRIGPDGRTPVPSPPPAPPGMVQMPPAGPAAGPPGAPTNYIDPVRNAQGDALGLLHDAALGNQPSAAEIAGKAAADRAASQQFGLAAALQGGMSAGGALRQASEGSAAILGQNANDMAANRAKEIENAQGQLVQGLGGLRKDEFSQASDQAHLNLETQLANQRAELTQRGLDNQQINALLAAQLEAMGIDAKVASAIVDANSKNAAADNAYKSAIINGVMSGGTSLVTGGFPGSAK